MKTILKFSLLALAAAALFSCQKPAELNEPVSGDKGISRTFTCVFAPGADSKVAVTDAGKTTWEVGDEILVHGAGGSNKVIVTLTSADISSDGKTATITVEGIEPYDRSDKGYTSTLYAQYPASLAGSEKEDFYYEARFSSSNGKLLAACDVDGSFVFYNLCGIISFKVSGEFDNYAFVGNEGETVTYEPFQARVYATENGPQVYYNYPGNGCNPVPMKSIKSAIDPDGSTTYYICIPAGENNVPVTFTNGFTFQFYDGVDLVKIAKTNSSLTIAPGQILALGDISSRLEDYVPPTTSDHKSAITGATDLSSMKANSFIITSPGAYKFPAVQGSSDNSVGNVFGAEIIWETYNNADEVTANSVIEAVDFEDNWIYFQTPSTLLPGNALIAAKDALDNIIWSWHIWIPADAITTNTYGIFNHELMDRNLGALVAATAGSPAPVESFGLTYQWGRKDPFPGPKAVDDPVNAAIAGTQIGATEGTFTVAQSIASPSTMAYTPDGDWISATDNTLWQNDEKTVYDPCPAGYKVLARDKNQPLFAGDFNTLPGWAEDEANYQVVFGNPLAVFPVGGYRDDWGPGKFSKIGQRVAYWTSYASSEAKGYIMNIRLAAYGDAHSAAETPKSRGAYVRCVKLETSTLPDPGNTDPDPGQGSEPEMPTGVNITIDGNMSEWADIPGAETPNNVCKVMKVYNDANNFYLYIACAPGSRGAELWGESAGYYYFDFDLDNNPETGDYEETSGNNGFFEAFMYLHIFGGTADDPYIKTAPNGSGKGMSIENISSSGVVTDELIEFELSVPRADMPEVSAGQKIRVLSWRSKSGTDITLYYTVL